MMVAEKRVCKDCRCNPCKCTVTSVAKKVQKERSFFKQSLKQNGKRKHVARGWKR